VPARACGHHTKRQESIRFIEKTTRKIFATRIPEFQLTEIGAKTEDTVEKLVAARVASLSTRRVERFENSCIGSVRVIPL
jgi:hypothetical protein